jgi:hypothetical protein
MIERQGKLLNPDKLNHETWLASALNWLRVICQNIHADVLIPPGQINVDDVSVREDSFEQVSIHW